MRFLSLVGSLTLGASLALALFQLPVIARAALLVIATASWVYLRSHRMRTNEIRWSRATYIVDKETERYSDCEIAEFYHALSEAKTNTTDPFYASESNRRSENRD
jgi:hypothetical protein